VPGLISITHLLEDRSLSKLKLWQFFNL
jgi:hypothetical protein